MTEKTLTRPANKADLAGISELAVRSFRDTFDKDNDTQNMEDYINSAMTFEQLEKDFDDESNLFLVAYPQGGDQLMGYAKLRNGADNACVAGERQIEIERIYADSSMIGKGVGAALMTECLSRAKQLDRDAIWLGVWERNPRAIRFYERWGFSTVGEQKFKLGTDIQNDLIMSKRLRGDET